MKKEKAWMSCYVDTDLKEWFEKTAEADERSVNFFVEKALQQYRASQI